MNLREKLLLLWACSATALLVVGGVVLFQMIQPRLASTARLGVAQDFSVGSPILFECDRTAGRCQPRGDTVPSSIEARYQPRSPDDFQVEWLWVMRDAAGTLSAFSAVSTHRGCFVKWEWEREIFIDPCSGAYWLSDGSYWQGPAPRGLDSFPVRMENGDVWIDFQLVRGTSHG